MIRLSMDTHQSESSERDGGSRLDARSPARWLVGVDIGGTFTDLVAVDVASGRRATAKALTTPSEPGRGILDVLELAGTDSGLTLERTAMFVHATTLAINTVIERTGAKVGLIATHGFPDVLEMGHGNRYDMFDLQIERQPPLVERRRRVPVIERTNAKGEIVTPLDAESQRTAIARLQAEGVESVAVCLLHAYKNGSHERAIKDGVASTLDGVPVSVSTEVAPIIREYERCVATVVNAYVAPRIASYLGALAENLRRRGYAGEPKIMRSDGGWFSASEASGSPVRILESGPAAGAIAAAETAVQRDAGLSVAFDMGGTTAKACLVVDGEPSIADGLEVSRLERFKKGSGLPIQLPSVDLIEIGAGGGSIAAIGPLGLLQVGPQSSGAVPGPACYGRGGERPTVTDADLLLGYLNASFFAGGSMRLDLDAAQEAIARELVRGHGLGFEDVTAAAWGIHDLVNENMARAVRLHCIEHGVDPTGISIVATGGAGPVHAAAIMSKIDAARVICPPNVGVASALGLLLAPRMDERTITDIVRLRDLDAAELERRLQRIAATVEDTGWSEELSVRRFVSARLRGQGHEVRVALPDAVSATTDVSERFRGEYARRFGRPPPADADVELVDWTVRFSEPGPVVGSSERRGEVESVDAAPTRPAYWGPTAGWQATAVHRRDRLAAGAVIVGPAVIEEVTSTVVVRPGQVAEVDDDGNVEIASGDGSRA